MAKYKPPRENNEQPTLTAYFDEEPVTRNYHSYRTDYHKIRVTDTRVQTFLRSLGKTTKKGVKKYTDEARHNKMCRFLTERAKPLVDKIRGNEYEASMKTLFKRIFDEDWDRDDFDNSALEADATSPKIAG